jgi:hypothetical protein
MGKHSIDSDFIRKLLGLNEGFSSHGADYQRVHRHGQCLPIGPFLIRKLMVIVDGMGLKPT